MTIGLFLSLDGLDGSGKSTQCRLLAEWLRARGHQVTVCADPGGTALGKTLRELLLGYRGQMALPCEALLFMASRSQLVADVIQPALERGEVVISDRFTLANLSYQGYGGGLNIEALRNVGHLASSGREPDLTFVLDVPVEIALGRHPRAADRIESRDLAYHERVRQGFLTEARLRPERIRVMDATLAPALVQQQIQEEVTRVLAARPGP